MAVTPNTTSNACIVRDADAARHLHITEIIKHHTTFATNRRELPPLPQSRPPPRVHACMRAFGIRGNLESAACGERAQPR